MNAIPKESLIRLLNLTHHLVTIPGWVVYFFFFMLGLLILGGIAYLFRKVKLFPRLTILVLSAWLMFLYALPHHEDYQFYMVDEHGYDEPEFQAIDTYVFDMERLRVIRGTDLFYEIEDEVRQSTIAAKNVLEGKEKQEVIETENFQLGQTFDLYQGSLYREGSVFEVTIDDQTYSIESTLGYHPDVKTGYKVRLIKHYYAQEDIQNVRENFEFSQTLKIYISKEAEELLGSFSYLDDEFQELLTPKYSLEFLPITS